VTFAETFRDIVLPDLECMAKEYGYFVASEEVDFDDAYQQIMAHATLRGANLLPDHLYFGLRDLISLRILEEVEASFKRGRDAWEDIQAQRARHLLCQQTT
jgi:hypothetical protein